MAQKSVEELEKELNELKEQLKDFVQQKHRPESTAIPYWDSGNFDDCFANGITVGESYAAEEIAAILGIDEDLPEHQEYEGF